MNKSFIMLFSDQWVYAEKVQWRKENYVISGVHLWITCYRISQTQRKQYIRGKKIIKCESDWFKATQSIINSWIPFNDNYAKTGISPHQWKHLLSVNQLKILIHCKDPNDYPVKWILWRGSTVLLWKRYSLMIWARALSARAPLSSDIW